MFALWRAKELKVQAAPAFLLLPLMCPGSATPAVVLPYRCRHKKVTRRQLSSRNPFWIRNQDVQLRSGFGSLLLLLCYAAIVCNGDVTKMIETTSTLTWFEEWFHFFEMVWWKTLTRWVGAENKYGINKRILRNVFDNRLAMVMKAVET